MFERKVDSIKFDNAKNGVVLTVYFMEPPKAYDDPEFEWDSLEHCMVFANDPEDDNGYEKAVEWLMEQFVPEPFDTIIEQFFGGYDKNNTCI